MVPNSLLRLIAIVSLFTVTEVFAQEVYSDTTAVPGISFELRGPYALENNQIVISKKTLIGFVRKGKNPVPNLGYSINGSKAVAYTGPFQIEKSGINKIGYKLMDADSPAGEFNFSLVVDNESPVITASIIYKSIKLKELTFRDSKDQNGTKKIECPVGSEIYVTATDNVFSTQNVFLKEGKASFKIFEGGIKLRSKGTHQYVIMAQDFVGNETETPPIKLEIIER